MCGTFLYIYSVLDCESTNRWGTKSWGLEFGEGTKSGDPVWNPAHSENEKSLSYVAHVDILKSPPKEEEHQVFGYIAIISFPKPRAFKESFYLDLWVLIIGGKDTFIILKSRSMEMGALLLFFSFLCPICVLCWKDSPLEDIRVTKGFGIHSWLSLSLLSSTCASGMWALPWLCPASSRGLPPAVYMIDCQGHGAALWKNPTVWHSPGASELQEA
jgi:hypothetical protein